MNQKEKELFLELCAFRAPNASKIERLLRAGAATSDVLGMLFSNRMAGVAYHVLQKTKLLDLVDREFRNSIRNTSLQNEKINEDYLGCTKFLTAELEACGVPYALLKGAFLCHWYPKGCRTSNDIDVLIAPEDVGKVSARLKLAGFRQGHLKNGVFVPASRQEIIESKMTRGETVPFIKEVKLPFMNYLEVDLNFSLDFKNSNDATLKDMLKRTHIMTVESAKIRMLDIYDFLLHLCAHLYKEATTVPWIRMKRDMTFYKYCDIYMLLRDMQPEELALLGDRADDLHVRREWLYCLASMDSFFKTDFLSDARLTELEKSELDEVIAPTEKKIYRYRVSDPKTRFFMKDRMKLLGGAREWKA